MILHVLVRRDTSRDPRDAGAYTDVLVGHSADGNALTTLAAKLTEHAQRLRRRYEEAHDRETAVFWAAKPDGKPRTTADPGFIALRNRLIVDAVDAGQDETAAIQRVDPGYRALQDVTYHALERDLGPEIATG